MMSKLVAFVYSDFDTSIRKKLLDSFGDYLYLGVLRVKSIAVTAFKATSLL